MNPVCDSAEQGDLTSLTHLVATGGDVNALGENGNSALAFACANGHAGCTSLLISTTGRSSSGVRLWDRASLRLELSESSQS